MATEKQRQLSRNWRAKNHEHDIARQRAWRQSLKLETLTHYGKNGNPQCCWDGCDIIDIDVLTLDHINNDGAAAHRNYPRRGPIPEGTRVKLGINMYSDLRQRGFPAGFQTLCANHQLKKEILRKRASKTP